MIRDPGPTFSLGWGASSRDHLMPGEGEQEGIRPESGAIAKALHDHPVMRFAAISAATMVGIATAGSLIKKGGIRLIYEAQERNIGVNANRLAKFREFQSKLDELQGIERRLRPGNEAEKLFVRGPDGKVRPGYTSENLKGFFFTQGEIERARRLGLDSTPAEWTLRREIQQRMVSQARRLPYELPAAYLTQRAITDPLFGGREGEKPVNWVNPIDVFTDFVTQSTRNTLGMLAPIEAGGASVTHGWRRLMTYGDDAVELTGRQRDIRSASLTLKTILSRVGADATDLLAKSIKVSDQTIGAFSSGLQEAQHGQTSIVDYWHRTRHGLKAAGELNDAKGLQKAMQQTSYLFKNQNLTGGYELPGIYDVFPGPFKGMGTAVGAARKEFSQIGQAHNALEEMMRMGRKGFEKKYQGQEKLDVVKKLLGRGSSPIEDLAMSMHKLGQGGVDSPGFAGSEFYTAQIRNEFNKQIQRQLVKHDVSADVAGKFSSLVNISAPGRGGRVGHVSDRVSFGTSPIYGDTGDEVFAELSKRLGMFGDQDRDALMGALPKALTKADDLFTNKTVRGSIDRRLANQWQVAQHESMRRHAGEILSYAREPYENFVGPFSQDQVSYLRRKTAQKSGISLVDDVGRTVDDRSVIEALAARGFDPQNPEQLRAYLVTKKAIAKPWQVGGRNVFGLRSLTVAESLDRGYFTGPKHAEQNIRYLTASLAADDPVSPLFGLFKMPGLHETNAGKVIDFSNLGRRARSIADRVQNEFQIPLIHIYPFKQLGAAARQEARKKPMVELLPGLQNQPFMQGGLETDDFYLSMKMGRGSKRRVEAYGRDDFGRINSRDLPGLYTPYSSGRFSMMARHARLAMGDRGQVPIVDPDAPPLTRGQERMSRFRQLFNISDDQPDSLFRTLDRFRNRKGDIRNPMVMARLLLDGEVVTRDGVRRLADFKPQELAKAMDTLGGLIRPNTYASRIVRRLQDQERFKGLFTYQFKPGTKPNTFKLNDRGIVKVDELSTTAQIREASELILEQEAQFARRFTGETAAALKSSQKSLIGRHLTGATNSTYWDTPTAQSAQTGTVFTRIDELKADIYRYLGVREGIIGAQDYDRLIPDLLGELSKLRSTGIISRAQFTEGQAAVLGMQINYRNFVNYDPELGNLSRNTSLRESLSAHPESREVLETIASGQYKMPEGLLRGYLDPLARRNFGISKYEYEGTEYNPFGQTDTVLIPSFGTAVDRTGVKAIASVIGGNTWSNPEAFSSASVPVSHMFERMNRFFSTAGLSLDATKYGGPLEYYAKGVIGQRVLPIVAGGTAALAVDRTIGAYTQPEDEYGEKVYSPFFLGLAGRGLAEAQAIGAGITPGGMTREEKREQLLEGEVPIRTGRYWPLGQTPFRGGRIQYYRPSWYRRMMSGYQYTDQTFGSPLERLAFGHDFSPLRPLDPYRFEREHYYDRPYPITGEYFSGPWGPLTTALNMTVGKVLKPQVRMHEEATAYGLGQYQPVGEAGAYLPINGIDDDGIIGGATGGGVPVMGGGGGFLPAAASQSQDNASLAAAGASPLNTGGKASRTAISTINAQYAAAASYPAIGGGPRDITAQSAYGMPDIGTNMPPRIIPSTEPGMTSDLGYQTGKLGYELQELFGIYGFAFSSLREHLGFGNRDFTSDSPVLASASQAYGTTRAFWDLNLGGLGDLPTPLEGNYANLEISEVIRRFVARERSATTFINPIPNELGQMHPWLPGNEYFTNFKTGDPFAAIQEGEMRLPGQGYERLNRLHADRTGKYGLVDQHKILGDVAPWSAQYKALDARIESLVPPEYMDRVETTREQVAAKTNRYEFHPYKYKYSTPEELGIGKIEYGVKRAGERIAHANSYFNTKFLPYRTAVEDWERENVYGQTFPQWQHPIEDFIKPLIYNASQRNPFTSALILGGVGSMFAHSAKGKMVASVLGGALGLGVGTVESISTAVSGERFVPPVRRRQLALEEDVDILTYVKNMRLLKMAEEQGNELAAEQYRRLAQQTMYGADIYNGNVNQLAMAIPRRKREHFRELLFAPPQERKQILSTAGRLERRIYQAAWGMQVESRPALDEYFSEHELPGPEWEGWHPNTNMEHVKIKLGQSLGIDMSQMGYYPQQVREANLVNPSYPAFRVHRSERDAQAQLRQLMAQQGIDGDVVPVATPFPGTRVQMHAGVW